MIDERIIEKAFKEYNEKVEKELSKRLIRKTTCAERYADTTSRQCAFYAGAKWMQEEFLKNLWHPASEEPDVRHKTIICLYEDGDIHQDYDAYDEATESDKLGRDKFNWDYYAEDNKIRNWCYETDLFPKEGDKK